MCYATTIQQQTREPTQIEDRVKKSGELLHISAPLSIQST